MHFYDKDASRYVTRPGDILIKDNYFGLRKNVTETFPFNDLLPIQDGYRFKIHSIVSPAGEELWKGTVAAGTYFTLHKGILLEINDKGRRGIYAEYYTQNLMPTAGFTQFPMGSWKKSSAAI